MGFCNILGWLKGHRSIIANLVMFAKYIIFQAVSRVSLYFSLFFFMDKCHLLTKCADCKCFVKPRNNFRMSSIQFQYFIHFHHYVYPIPRLKRKIREEYMSRILNFFLFRINKFILTWVIIDLVILYKKRTKNRPDPSLYYNNLHSNTQPTTNRQKLLWKQNQIQSFQSKNELIKWHKPLI